MAQKLHDNTCLICEDLSEDSVVEAEQVLDLRLGEAALGRGDVAGHVAHKEMAVPPLELCIHTEGIDIDLSRSEGDEKASFE